MEYQTIKEAIKGSLVNITSHKTHKVEFGSHFGQALSDTLAERGYEEVTDYPFRNAKADYEMHLLDPSGLVRVDIISTHFMGDFTSIKIHNVA